MLKTEILMPAPEYERYEDTLCKGIFWLTGDSLVLAKIPVESDGTIPVREQLKLNSRNADNYNHRMTWETFPASVTKGRPFNYFPRGRIEIRNNRATVYLSPHLLSDEYLELIKSECCLDAEHGITKVRCIPDYSDHYKCRLDKQDT